MINTKRYHADLHLMSAYGADAYFLADFANWKRGRTTWMPIDGPVIELADRTPETNVLQRLKWLERKLDFDGAHTRAMAVGDAIALIENLSGRANHAWSSGMYH
jgi:hypothetical protein